MMWEGAISRNAGGSSGTVGWPVTGVTGLHGHTTSYASLQRRNSGKHCHASMGQASSRSRASRLYQPAEQCSGCGEQVPTSLSVCAHLRPHCGLVLDCDEKAALNILRAGQARQARTWVDAPSVARVAPG
jgi:hypothetical protein